MTEERGLLCWCRPGFEAELAAELSARAAEAGFTGYARTERGSALVRFHCAQAAALDRAVPFAELIFARQKLRVLADLKGLDSADRIAPMLAALRTHAGFGDLWVEYPDSESGRPLAGLARAFGNALRPRLRKAGLLGARPDPSRPRLHVCFVASDHALLATSRVTDSAPWPLGIARLRVHPDAPSRSALKLEEALLTLLDTEERARLLQSGMRAADLGAAPGGWSWVLARHGLSVIAIDNGALAASAHATGLIRHLRADGFTWRPEHPLDWMVCDMVEQPRRVAARVGEWFAQGWCRQAIFNLKLPMKKRWEETVLCLDLLRKGAACDVVVRARQLHHDREEITLFARTTRRAR